MPKKQAYTKPALTISQQIDLLTSRGLAVPDKARAEHYLKYISYYRLSIYARSLQLDGSSAHDFQVGTTFDDILKRYTFDRELRLLVLDAIERIEVALRGTIAYEFSMVAGANWYADSSLFKNSEYFSHAKEMERIGALCNRSKEVFMQHHKKTYDSLPPSWKLLEAMTVGEIEKLYVNMDVSDKRVRMARSKVAQSFGVSHSLLDSWFRPVCLLRNICAHHGRLWNRKLIYRPDAPRNPHVQWVSHAGGDRQKIYMYLCVVQSLMTRVNPHSIWKNRLISLMEKYPEIPRTVMGFHDDWQDDDFWVVVPKKGGNV
ncbi:MAG: Abi family protein [Ghiorsea sp.]|nr:Abi family protein [Ghiorsea sp.]